MKKQKIYTPEEKQLILAQGEANGVAITCREHGVSTSLYYTWRRKLKEHGADGLSRQSRATTVYPAEIAQLERDNALLKKLLAEKEMELSLAKELIKKKFSPVRK
jgi:putative transposase